MKEYPFIDRLGLNILECIIGFSGDLANCQKKYFDSNMHNIVVADDLEAILSEGKKIHRNRNSGEWTTRPFAESIQSGIIVGIKENTPEKKVEITKTILLKAFSDVLKEKGAQFMGQHGYRPTLPGDIEDLEIGKLIKKLGL